MRRLLSARNGHAQLQRRVEHLELATTTTTNARQQVDEAERMFESLPECLQRYFATTEWTRERQYDLTNWLKLAVARTNRGQDAVVYLSGWVLRDAWHKLGWLRILASGSNTWDNRACPGADQAARELLGSSQDELHALWAGDPEGGRWVALWRQTRSHDPEVLELAGLGVAELELLDAAAADG